MSKERKCIFCGATYLYCNHCNEYVNEPKWKFNFDSEKCHDLYGVIGGYNIGVNTIEDVKSTLDKYNVTDYSIFSKKLQDKLNELVPTNVETEKKEQPEVKKNDSNSNKKEGNFNTHKMKKNNKYNFERRDNTEE